MTTVVVTKKEIVADRRILIVGDEGGRHYRDGAKIKISNDGTFAYGSTGMLLGDEDARDTEFLIGLLVTHVNSGASIEDPGFADMVRGIKKKLTKPHLILTRKTFIGVIDGVINVADNSVDYFVIGTGTSFANIALQAGQTPKAAVGFATRYDALSGGPVDVITATKLKAAGK